MNYEMHLLRQEKEDLQMKTTADRLSGWRDETAFILDHFLNETFLNIPTSKLMKTGFLLTESRKHSVFHSPHLIIIWHYLLVYFFIQCLTPLEESLTVGTKKTERAQCPIALYLEILSYLYK